MSRREDVTPFLPTLKRARAAGLPLPSGKPSERRPLAALVVMARLLSREGWRERKGVAQYQLPKLRRTAPPANPKRPGTYQVLHRYLFTEPCSKCAGKGRRRSQKPGCKYCWACVEVDHYRDSLRSMRETYVPLELSSVPALFSFERALEDVVPKNPPECLRCLDLRPRVVGSAYRSAGHEKRPTFFGHDFGNTIEQGIEALDKFMLRGTIVAHEIKAYAWPILWLRWSVFDGGHEVVLFVDGRRRLRSFVGVEPDLTE